ncbi:hypothetical protein T484DRAFT_1883904 [Baffinella frigidus]|nr:hypothetical protein T484DRAFT_1883904 [Cryptophyta sp. CCMP2293]
MLLSGGGVMGQPQASGQMPPPGMGGPQLDEPQEQGDGGQATPPGYGVPLQQTQGRNAPAALQQVHECLPTPAVAAGGARKTFCNACGARGQASPYGHLLRGVRREVLGPCRRTLGPA